METLRILNLEDSPLDAELVHVTLTDVNRGAWRTRAQGYWVGFVGEHRPPGVQGAAFEAVKPYVKVMIIDEPGMTTEFPRVVESGNPPLDISSFDLSRKPRFARHLGSENSA
jgi:hypothetical protein